ncbi:MAG: DUF420 domain-containing protein [Myxococcota bacterium]
MPGLFGTRATLLVDLVIIIFVVMPVALVIAIWWAKLGNHDRHRLAQGILFLTMTVAVTLLEVDIRMQGGTEALAGRAVSVDVSAVRALLLIHIGVATITWVGWLVLLATSHRRYCGKRSPALPGAFSRSHRRMGRWVFAGVTFTSVTGAGLYVLAFT